MEIGKFKPTKKRELPIEILNDETLKKAIHLIKETCSPKKIYFYGSRANRTHGKDSDYDFVVVVEKSDLPKIDRRLKILRVLGQHDIAADVFVYTQPEFDNWKDEFSSIPETAMNTGYEVGHL